MIVLLWAVLTSSIDVSAIELNRDDDAHYWKPKKNEIAKLEQDLRVPERMGGPSSNFDRYYTGVFRQGHHILFVEFVYLSKRPAGQGKIHVVSPKKVPAIADGGCGVVRFSYDEVTKQASALECNFALPLPPPPPRDAH